MSSYSVSVRWFSQLFSATATFAYIAFMIMIDSELSPCAKSGPRAVCLCSAQLLDLETSEPVSQLVAVGWVGCLQRGLHHD